jgi:alkylated DNA repair dioxygenase AlkB
MTMFLDRPAESHSRSAKIMAARQLSLFDAPPAMPEGFDYKPDLVSPDEQQALAAAIATLPLQPFEFRGYSGKRRVLSFGRRYDWNAQQLGWGEPIPDFLLPLRTRAASFAGLPPDALAQALVTEYAPGAGINWHRDRPEFGVVIGVSLLAPCVFRLRLKNGEGWDRAAMRLEPGSAYRMTGPARRQWEHSIPPMQALRYSVTFRTMREY